MDGVFASALERPLARRLARDSRYAIPICIILICGCFAAAALLQMRLDRAHALAEAANLVALPGRNCANGKPVPLNDPTFQKGLASLREVSMLAYKTAQEKKQDAMLDVADKLTQACATCHDVYRDIQVDGKPAGIEARCNPKP